MTFLLLGATYNKSSVPTGQNINSETKGFREVSTIWMTRQISVVARQLSVGGSYQTNDATRVTKVTQGLHRANNLGYAAPILLC